MTRGGGGAHRFGARALRAGLALALALSPVLGALHEASTRHVTCPEDGELIDASAQSAHAHPRADAGGPEIFPELPLGPEVPGHDHCVVALHLRTSGGLVIAHAAVAPPQRVIEPTVMAPSALPTGVDALYRIAPKGSPPA